ncbi:hypothetical protein ALC62_05834 [Cyphomyrmex costatus]|uniref:Uncharacterized protein n=1 Tax=Cyphomyrmex costatus TaxID=456900 RepID=A0A151IJH1_9HYME|nr:hypothetical protein ALC62_05834 [Cyphomyrmex costatus]
MCRNSRPTGDIPVSDVTSLTGTTPKMRRICTRRPNATRELICSHVISVDLGGLSVERITEIVKGSEVDRMAVRVIAAETIAAISDFANSLSSHPRHFGTAGTPGNVHPGNFGVVLLVPFLSPYSSSYRRSGALSHFPMKGTLREKHIENPSHIGEISRSDCRDPRSAINPLVPAGDRSLTHSPQQSIRKFTLEIAFRRRVPKVVF